MPDKLFVYGTLGPNRPNEHILKDIGGSWKDASVRGFLREEGWGAQMGYPGIDLDKNGKEIKGFLFISSNLSKNWKKLDDFEGKEYSRVITQAKLNDNTIIDTYIYMLQIK